MEKRPSWDSPIYSAQLNQSRLIRELGYGNPGDTTIKVNIPNTASNGSRPQHTFTLHRFVAIVASNHGFSIFQDKNVLLNLGIDLEAHGNNALDEFLAYHKDAEATEDEIIRSLRVGPAHSRQCDW